MRVEPHPLCELGGKADPAQQFVEAWVRPQRVEGLIHFQPREVGVALAIGLFKPREGLFVLAEGHINCGEIARGQIRAFG